ncbi:MAG: HEPN domain-containing protein [Deltaproteobacteria bacterium]|nr:HEPN domain-containing protein [Deltaproteobacteria bacterium]
MLGQFTADLAEISPYAIEARYPGEWEPLTQIDAERAVEIAERFRNAIAHLLSPEICGDTPSV